jgi:hypothetical protein
MAKRFTESDKWLDTWFAELTPAFKLAWVYLVDRCDAAGVVDLSPRIASALIGDTVDWEAFIEASEGRVERLETGKLWVTGFCSYQYGDVRSVAGDGKAYNPHRAVIKSIEKNQLPVPVDGVLISSRVQSTLSEPSARVEDKDKIKTKVKTKKEKEEPPAADPVEAVEDSTLRESLRSWFAYKAQRSERYKPAGADALIRKATSQAATHGVEAICGVINDSMASNYAGIVWDRLSRGSPGAVATQHKTRGQAATERFLARHKGSDHGDSGLRRLGSEPDLRGVRSPSG